jgi:NAD+ diphosphatase
VKTPHGFVSAHALPAVIPAGALVFAFRGDRVLVIGSRDREDPTPPRLPTWAEATALGLDGAAHVLGSMEGCDCVALRLANDAPEPLGWRFAGLRSLFFSLPEPLLALAGRASQVVEWDRTHRFCGACGTPTRNKGDERAKECPACGLVAYPRVSPAMMVLVTRGKELLLARAHRFPQAMFSALAGFVEPGESIEDCIHREVHEEVGVRIEPPVYFDSQPWPFPHSLMIAYTAEYAAGDIRVDDAEIAEARWFSVDALPDLPSKISIARRLIDTTAARLRA